MVHPPRPGAQCRHHTPDGLSSSSTCASLQHSEQSPHVRPGRLLGIFVSVLMTATDYHMMHRGVTAQFFPLPLSPPAVRGIDQSHTLEDAHKRRPPTLPL